MPTARRPQLATPGLTRLGETTMRRLRTQRHALVHGHAYGTETPKCPLCSKQATIEHILQECSAAKPHRKQLLPPQTTTHDLLLDNAEAVLRYLAQAKFLDAPIKDYLRE